MRPQQQNRRMRGRNNNNNNGGNNNRGKGNPNPLTRSYESNGPDVKIRGNAQQIAEKYTTLARDAQSSGDRVMAENYLQHAEHYNRIIAAAQAAMPIQNFQQNRDDFDEEEGEELDANGAELANGNYGSGPQPVIDGVPAEVALNGEAGELNGESQPRQRDGNRNRNRRDRDGRDQDGRERNRDFRNGENRREFRPRDAQPEDGQSDEAQPSVAAVADVSDGDSLPAFVTGAAPAPVEEPAAPRRSRRPRRGEQAAEAGEVAPIVEPAPEALVASED